MLFANVKQTRGKLERFMRVEKWTTATTKSHNLLDKCYSLKVGLKNPKEVNHRIPDKSEICSFFPTSDSGEAQDYPLLYQ